MGKGRISQHGAVAEDLVKDIRLLQVVELITAPDKGGHRKLAVGQQGEEAIERDKRRHRRHRPAGRRLQDGVDLGQLGDALTGQPQSVETGQILVTPLAIESGELTFDQDLPGTMLLVAVVDHPVSIRLVGGVEGCHSGSILWRHIRRLAVSSRLHCNEMATKKAADP